MNNQPELAAKMDDQAAPNITYRLGDSIAATALRSLATPITLAIFAMTLLAYAYFFSMVKEQHLEKIALFSKERVNYELGIFRLAEDNLITARKHLLDQLAVADSQTSLKHFQQLTEHLKDGTYRSPLADLDSQLSPQIFVSRKTRISDQVARTISASATSLGKDGPAWRNRFPNLYFVGKEDYATIYWAGEFVIDNMSADFTHLDKGFYLIGTPEQNPEGLNRWTSVYLSVSGLNKWMVSSITPVYQNQAFLGILGQDIYLDNLMTRTIKDHPDGANNMLITESGKLIAHPNYMEQITNSKDGLDILNRGDSNLKSIYRLVNRSFTQSPNSKKWSTSDIEPHIIEDTDNERYLVATPMANMGWILITEYPKQLISQLAFSSSRTVLLLGAALLMIELIVLFTVIRRKVSFPLNNLGIAAHHWGSKDKQFSLDQYRQREDEIGDLTRNFLDLQNTVNYQFKSLREEIERRKSVEQDLEKQSKELSSLNDNLDLQFKERTKDLEQEAREHRLLGAAIEHAAESIMIANHKFEIEYVNQAFERISGYTGREVIGRTPMALNRFRGDQATQNAILSSLQKGVIWSGQVSNTTKQGEVRNEEATMSPMRNSAGEITHYIEVKRDITEKLELEQQLNNAHKLEAIGQLAAGIAHEINTPAQFIGDNIRFLKDAYDDFEDMFNRLQQLPEIGHKAYIENVIEETDMAYLSQEIPGAIEQSLEGVERITRIVGAMKEFAHPSRAKTLTDLNQTIKNTITVTLSEWRYVADMKTDFAEDLPSVNCQQGEINQVLLNIIINAAHAIAEAHDKGEKGTIAISTSYQSELIKIKISDDGIGMSEEVKARIFEPFFTTKEVGKGVGQGLNMVYKVIVTNHGGNIQVESEPGKGTRFTISLPVENNEASIAS